MQVLKLKNIELLELPLFLALLSRPSELRKLSLFYESASTMQVGLKFLSSAHELTNLKKLKLCFESAQESLSIDVML